MVRFTADDYVDVEKYDAALNRLGYVLYSIEDGNEAVNYLSNKSDTLAARAKFIMRLRSGDRYFTLQRETVYNYLTREEFVPDHYFWIKRAKSFSLDMKDVLDKILKNGKAVDFLTEYMAYRSSKAMLDNLRKLVGCCKEPVAKDVYGKDLAKIGFTASEQVNRRFNYKQFDIISQIPKDNADMICAEDGYFLAWGDFAQSDFRIAYNLFMRSEENDAIMNKYADKYEGLARIVSKSLDREFDIDNFKQERKLYKKLTLATVYGMRTSSVPEEAEFIQMFTRFLEKCQKYSEYFERLKDNCLLKEPIKITSYFGYEQYVMHNKFNAQKQMYDALNTPNQTGTSELVILTVNSILDTARECGLTEDQFGLYMTRHDEPIFRIKEDVIDYLWILKKHSEILVDDWTPLRMDFDYGYHYKQSDTGLCKKAEAIFAGYNEEESAAQVVDSRHREEYYPIKPLLKLKFHYFVVEELKTTVATFEEVGSGKAIFSLFGTTNQEEIIDAMRYRIQQAASKINGNYSAVLVYNNFVECEDFFGLRVKYQKECSSSMDSVVRLCKGMTKLFYKKNGLKAPEQYNVDLQEFPKTLEVLYLEEKENG